MVLLLKLLAERLGSIPKKTISQGEQEMRGLARNFVFLNKASRGVMNREEKIGPLQPRLEKLP
jgi:hypothetical protein